MNSVTAELDYLPDLPVDRSTPIGCIGAGFIVADCHLVAYQRAGFTPLAIAARDPAKARHVAQQRVHVVIECALRPHGVAHVPNAATVHGHGIATRAVLRRGVAIVLKRAGVRRL